ncbi:hypothetical protein MSPP1_000031 [Malassezia sp. CBS 17886]|nr:hypothetical protein MSPP1_000031 [Malassezia sp. CBS 17886]
MARDRLAAMRAQQAAAGGGVAYGGGTGAGNNGYGDHMYPTQQTSAVDYAVTEYEQAAPGGRAPDTVQVTGAAYSTPPVLQAPTDSAYGQTGGAYGQTGGAYDQAGSTYGQTGSAYGQTGSAYGQTGGAYPQTSSAYGQTGSAYPQTGSAYPQTGSAYPQTGSAYGQAGGAAAQPDSYEMQQRGTTTADPYGAADMGAGGAGGAGADGAYGTGAAGSYAVNMPSDASTGNTFFAAIGNIQDMIRQIDQNINRIADLHSRSLNNVGESAQLAAEQELAGVAQETSSLTNSVKNKIKTLESEALKVPTSGPAPEGVDRNVRLTQIGAVKNRFKETILRYQEVEKAYRTKYRQRAERQLRIVKPDATQDEIQGVLEGESGGQQIFSQALMQSNRQGEARGALREVEERHTDIRRIEMTITELAQLFQEMSILVEQQDEQLNVIKDHAQHTEQEVTAGRQHTDKAVISAKRARKKRWICFWILVVFICIVIAVVVGAVCGSGVCKSDSSNNNSGK